MNVNITKVDGSQEEMGVEEFSRWMCLVEAFHLIEQRGKEMGISDPISLVKANLVEKYIVDRYDSMLHDVKCEVKLGNL